MSNSSVQKYFSGPWTNITIDFEAIIRSFQDACYIGELRQRWNEINKLNHSAAQESTAYV
jgi:hypothetical protein